MKELIKVAEELYKQIDKAQVHLVNARLNNNEEGKKSATSEMETAMCNTIQLLKCFIERKANIVDLCGVWHDTIEKPDGGKVVLIDTCDGYIARTLASRSDEKWRCLAGIEKWRSFVDIYIVKRWAYLDDLLPKGGDNDKGRID